MNKGSFQVSVVTPVFNAERFVRRAVESAVHLPEVGEVILIDDAGPDNSLEVCQQLERQHTKVKLLRHPDQGNHGAGASRNLGIEHARYDFVAFLDADDYYLTNRFEKDREILSTDESVDGVYGAIGIDYDSAEARQKFHDAGYAYQEFLTFTGPVPPEELIEVLFGSHPSVAGEFSTIGLTVRKSLFGRSGVFNENLRLRQDIHLWRRMAAVGRLMPGSLDKPIAMRGVHGANRMTDPSERVKYREYWWEDLHEWFRNGGNIPPKARKTFELAFCRYRIKYRGNWEKRWVFLSHIAKHPRLIAESMGFFDLFFFEAIGRNWLTLHFVSAKNRMLNRGDRTAVRSSP